MAGKRSHVSAIAAEKSRHIRLRIRDENSILSHFPKTPVFRMPKKAVHHHRNWILSHLIQPGGREPGRPPLSWRMAGTLPLLNKKWRLLLFNTERLRELSRKKRPTPFGSICRNLTGLRLSAHLMGLVLPQSASFSRRPDSALGRVDECSSEVLSG